MKEDTRNLLRFFIGLFIILGLLVFMAIRNRIYIGRQIQVNIGYAIGTYLYVSGSAARGETSLFITFDAENKKFENIMTKGKLTGYTKAQEKDHFLVIYDTLNPINCQILFDYPIKDSTDFIQYLEEFKKKPLDISKYF